MIRRLLPGHLRPRTSLRTQTAVAMAVTVGSALAVVLVLLLWGAGRYLQRDLETRARDYALLSTPGISESYERYHESGVYKMRQQMAETLRRSEDVISVSVLDVNGLVLFDSELAATDEAKARAPGKVEDPWIVDAVRRLEPSERRLSPSITDARFEVVVPYMEEWGRHRLSTLYSFSYRRLRDRLAYATFALSSVSAAAIALSFLVGSLAARRVSRPLAVMTRRVQEIGEGERGSRLAIDPGAFDELRVFAEAFNAMAAEIDRYIETLSRSNRDLSAANLALEAKNAELERYAYTASHELKTPLITINSYAGLVERAATALNSDRIRNDAARIMSASGKMRERLDDLLNLARAGRIANPTESISLTALAEEARGLCEGGLAAAGVTLSIEPGMSEVLVDRVRFVEVFQNLIENAIKFTRGRPSPQVEIGVRQDGAQRTFFVKDNGIGIPARFHDRVFGLFDKLDPRTEGSGVGLAVVRRIVEVHGGRVWIESDGEGHGTTICFTLP
ncbi:MAG: sensor histidine kinase [Vicinamibacteria bacterium]|nr:sensor histidine kinase [Vicinamibacteria bacterium]